MAGVFIPKSRRLMLKGMGLAIHGTALGIYPDNYHCKNIWTCDCNFTYGGYSHNFEGKVEIMWDTLLTPDATGEPDGPYSVWEDGALPILWVTNTFLDNKNGWNPHYEQFDPALAIIEHEWKNTYGDNAISFKKADNAAVSLILPSDAPQLSVAPGSLVVWRGVTFPEVGDTSFSGEKQSSLAKFLRKTRGDNSIGGAVVAFAYSEWDIDKFAHIRTWLNDNTKTLYLEMPRHKSVAKSGGSSSTTDVPWVPTYTDDWVYNDPNNCVLQGVSVYGNDIVSLARQYSQGHPGDGTGYPDIYVPIRAIVIDAKFPHSMHDTRNAYNGYASALFYAKADGVISSYSDGLPNNKPKGTASAYSLKSSIKELNI